MTTPSSAATAKRPLKERMQGLVVEYGRSALVVYFAIFATVLVGFALAIRFGVGVEGAAVEGAAVEGAAVEGAAVEGAAVEGAAVEGAAATASTWGAAYVATKLTQPLRILATLALTPLVVKLMRRKKRPAIE